MTTAWFRTSLFGWFLAYWFVGNFVIYSWAGEKMPWLLPHVAMPLVLLAARWLGDWSERVSAGRAVLAAVAAGGRAGAGRLHDGRRLPGAGRGADAESGTVQAQALVLERYTLIGLTLAAIAGVVYLAVGARVRSARRWSRSRCVVLASFYIRTSWMVTYKHGDIPVEMLVYVQSSPDMPWVDARDRADQLPDGQREELRILMDNGYTEDVDGQRVVHEAVSWPFEWYLRDYKNRRYYSKTIGPDINLRDYPVILVMAPNLDPIKDQLGDYVGQKYRLNWWFPEDYKHWATNPGAHHQQPDRPDLAGEVPEVPALPRADEHPRRARVLPVRPAGRADARAGRDRRAAAPQAGARPAPPVARRAARHGRRAARRQHASCSGSTQTGEPQLIEPKGVAVGPDGRIYVSEGRGNRITVFNAGRHDRGDVGAERRRRRRVQRAVGHRGGADRRGVRGRHLEPPHSEVLGQTAGS